MMKKEFLRLSLFCLVGMMILSSCKKEFTITVQSNNEEWGTVLGGGIYTEGAAISIEAKANKGCQFVSWQDGNTDNPRTITVKSDETYVAIFTSWNQDVFFSVSATQKVYFSSGNLQWSAVGSHAVADGGTAAGTWRFAPHQWDTIGANNSNISSTYTGWIDLFCWGTSGYNGIDPYDTYIPDTAYGSAAYNITGTYFDWGIYNAINNPITNTTDAPGTWRALTYDEWNYLLNFRNTSSGVRYAYGVVMGISGLIIVPDNWSTSTYQLNQINKGSTFTSNTIDIKDWVKMEAEGCVFLPAAGDRGGTVVYSVISFGSYWSTSGYYLAFTSDFIGQGCCDRTVGQAVRLVRDVK